MKQVKLKGHTVEIYDSIEEMPMWRYHKFTQFMVLQSGIGSDMEAISDHLRRLKTLVAQDKVKAMKEIDDLHLALHIVDKGINLKGYAFVTLVATVDGKECNDLSEEGIKRTYELLSEASYKSVSDIVDAVKKKLIRNLVPIFPIKRATQTNKNKSSY